MTADGGRRTPTGLVGGHACPLPAELRPLLVARRARSLAETSAAVAAAATRLLPATTPRPLVLSSTVGATAAVTPDEALEAAMERLDGATTTSSSDRPASTRASASGRGSRDGRHGRTGRAGAVVARPGDGAPAGPSGAPTADGGPRAATDTPARTDQPTADDGVAPRVATERPSRPTPHGRPPVDDGAVPDGTDHAADRRPPTVGHDSTADGHDRLGDARRHSGPGSARPGAPDAGTADVDLGGGSTRRPDRSRAGRGSTTAASPSHGSDRRRPSQLARLAALADRAGDGRASVPGGDVDGGDVTARHVPTARRPAPPASVGGPGPTADGSPHGAAAERRARRAAATADGASGSRLADAGHDDPGSSAGSSGGSRFSLPWHDTDGAIPPGSAVATPPPDDRGPAPIAADGLTGFATLLDDLLAREAERHALLEELS